jgi:GlcNAc-P-P-Und epimerase
MKRICITGGSGFIASHFISALPDCDIHILDLVPPKFQSHALYYKGDIRNLNEVLHAFEGCDTIIHLAAMHHDFGIPDEAYFDTNVNGAKVILEAATALNIKSIINFSSVAVYGNKGNPGPTSEDTEPAPTSPYGFSKLEAEELFSLWQAESNERKLITVRSTVVFGSNNLANVLNLIKAIDTGFYIQVGKGENIKSLAYVGNIVAASLFAYHLKDSGKLMFNYVDGPQLSSKAIAAMQARMLGKKIRLTLPMWLVLMLAKPFDFLILLSNKNLPISSKRVKKLSTQTYHSAGLIKNLGFVAPFSIEYGMQEMINWYRAEHKK